MFSAPSAKIKILIYAVNPTDTDKLRLDKEVHEIDEGLRRSHHRDKFELESKWAIKQQDFHRYLLDVQPQVLHFSGHGGGEHGIVLENTEGKVQFLQTEQLAALFKLFAHEGLRCVLLNACYSEEQAKAISQHVDYVIGMKKAIGDEAAIAFSVTFYDALGAGKTVEFAFELARIRLMGMKANEIPVLIVNQEVVQQPSKKVFISYCSQAPDRELAEQFFEALNAAGHEAFMAEKSIGLGENWVKRIDVALEQSDYFLLLLSEQSAANELVAKEVLRAGKLYDRRDPQRPTILPIRVNFPMDSPLDDDLKEYLQVIWQWKWESPLDTHELVQKVITLLSKESIRERDKEKRSPRKKIKEWALRIMRESERNW